MISLLYHQLFLGVILGGLFLVSCAQKNEQEAPSASRLAEQIPPSMRAQKDRAEDFAPLALPGEKTLPTSPVQKLLRQTPLVACLPSPSADDLIWTDPDNPDQNLGSVEAAFAKPSKGPWQVSYLEALRESYTRELPLLIWFTNSRSSPTCKALSRDLFSRTDFGTWAEQNVVRLRIDTISKEKDMKRRERKRRYVEKLKKRFGVTGHPTVLVLAPDGKVVGRYKGFRTGESEFYWGRIKNAAKTVDEGYYDWVLKMQQKGYRTWTGRNGVKLFAKLRRYESPRLLVVEPHGKKTLLNEKTLSKSDQNWLSAEKKKRGLAP